MIQAIPVKHSIAYLEARLLTPERALDNISQVASMGRCLALFEHFFPEELSSWRELSVTRQDVRQAIIERFHELVSMNLFPLLDYYAEEDSDGFFHDTISPYPQCWEWWEETPDSYDDLTRAILEGAGMLSDDRQVPAYDFPWMDFDKLDQKSRPLCWLRDAVEILALRTGSDFLDMSMEDMYSGYIILPEWSVATVEFLRDDWKLAQEKLAHWRQLLIWITGSERRFKRVKKLVSDAVYREDGEPKSGKPKSGKPLIEILT